MPIDVQGDHASSKLSGFLFATSRRFQLRDVAGFRLPVDARRHMRRLRPGILFIAVQEKLRTKTA
jgi:hypothetical protein